MNLKRIFKSRFQPLLLFGSAGVVAVAAVAAAFNTQVAYFRIANLSPNAPALDIYVNGTLVQSGLEFGQVGPTSNINHKNEHLLLVRRTGADPTSAPVLQASVYLDPGATYVLVLANYVNGLQVAPMRIPIRDIPANLGRVQFIHAFPGGPRVDLDINGAPAFDNIGYLEHPQYREFNPATIAMNAYQDYPRSQLFNGNLTIEAHAVHTVIFAGPPVTPLVITTRLDANGLPVIEAPAE